ncbi:MAG: DUF3141 domain-containing protein [Alphaproteobacteria bacterium]|nr:DUF3141 domain-containing protein [Alphaproteobacteria bacterium]MCL2504684.1 DUF3141 domain-containing protein [Alphaproteobacteria bacterium]
MYEEDDKTPDKEQAEILEAHHIVENEFAKAVRRFEELKQFCSLPVPTTVNKEYSAINGKIQRLMRAFIKQTHPLEITKQAMEYWIDSMQRSVLFMDVLRQRSNTHIEYEKQEKPTVLYFKYEMILDGKTLAKPVNYYLLKILPPEGVETDPKKRPVIVFDPRAGHGPGIGGMKENSEIGGSLKMGYPCYFVGFFPKPVEGQTIEDVCNAEAVFISKVIEMHPEAPKPCLIGNCQAGWQIAIVAAVYPELVGVLVLPGAPMSYWMGVRGENPMRYEGGLALGSWVSAFMSDLGNGLFDGAWLVSNFERLNPANTYWKKAHNLYSKIDTEVQRFLDFEKWWGSPVFLNKKEIQFIVNGLFIGNRLSGARLRTSDRLRIDLRNIKSPILVFCSYGDDITPPQQALGWITDGFKTDEEIIVSGQTIIYALHETIGHLGIFVSSSVSTKEHEKFMSNLNLIESLPPGLYEAVVITKDDSTEHAGLASGDYVIRFEERKLDDIRAIGGNSEEDDRCFYAVKRVSESMLGLYETYVSPWVRACSNSDTAEVVRNLHPIRVRYKMFSDENMLLSWVTPKIIESVKANRRPVSEGNFFWNLQEVISDTIIANLNVYHKAKDMLTEKLFFEIYGDKFTQAFFGLLDGEVYARYAAFGLERERNIKTRMAKLLNSATKGGLPEALMRGLLYVVRGGNGFDEREFRMLRQLCDASKVLPKLSNSEFRDLMKTQHGLLNLDERNALKTIPMLLTRTTEAAAREALSAIHTVVRASGAYSMEERRRLEELENYFSAATSSQTVDANKENE